MLLKLRTVCYFSNSWFSNCWLFRNIIIYWCLFFNDKYKTNRHIVVAVDEAHVFINPKRPIALEFMANMAKRIRKYGGSFLPATQNIAD